MIKTLCDMCSKAEYNGCPIFPQKTWDCIEYSPDKDRIKTKVKMEMYKNGIIKETLRDE